MIEISKKFTFEAAHQLAANVDPEHMYANLHGHSFRVQIVLRGEPDNKTGWLIDFADFEEVIEPVRKKLDHNYLNTIEGLQLPTLENITQWIWQQLETPLPNLNRVIVKRGTCGESCTYSIN
jgi:6-pyruvoyltetrahydropterin/6-carboxytetrahydropterin synthase